jgi:hypothetical protein
VYEYAKKFNALCHYGGHHVDNNAKKIEHFRDGLHGDLYERLNLYEPNNYQDLVNKAISQEDAMSKAQRDRKRKAGFTTTGGSGKKFRFIKKVLRVLPSHLQLDTGGWPCLRTSHMGTFRSVRHSSSPTSLVHPQLTTITPVLPRIIAVIIVGSPGIHQ